MIDRYFSVIHICYIGSEIYLSIYIYIYINIYLSTYLSIPILISHFLRAHILTRKIQPLINQIATSRPLIIMFNIMGFFQSQSKAYLKAHPICVLKKIIQPVIALYPYVFQPLATNRNARQNHEKQLRPSRFILISYEFGLYPIQSDCVQMGTYVVT